MNKTNQVKQMYPVLLISMIASISFGVIDAINFLFIEHKLETFWKKFSFLDDKTIPLINGGIAAAISILIAVYIEHYLELHYTLFKHPALDATGVIIGTILVILLNKLYTKYYAILKKKKDRHQ